MALFESGLNPQKALFPYDDNRISCGQLGSDLLERTGDMLVRFEEDLMKTGLSGLDSQVHYTRAGKAWVYEKLDSSMSWEKALASGQYRKVLTDEGGMKLCLHLSEDTLGGQEVDSLLWVAREWLSERKPSGLLEDALGFVPMEADSAAVESLCRDLEKRKQVGDSLQRTQREAYENLAPPAMPEQHGLPEEIWEALCFDKEEGLGSRYLQSKMLALGWTLEQFLQAAQDATGYRSKWWSKEERALKGRLNLRDVHDYIRAVSEEYDEALEIFESRKSDGPRLNLGEYAELVVDRIVLDARPRPAMSDIPLSDEVQIPGLDDAAEDAMASAVASDLRRLSTPRDVVIHMGSVELLKDIDLSDVGEDGVERGHPAGEALKAVMTLEFEHEARSGVFIVDKDAERILVNGRSCIHIQDAEWNEDDDLIRPQVYIEVEHEESWGRRSKCIRGTRVVVEALPSLPDLDKVHGETEERLLLSGDIEDGDFFDEVEDAVWNAVFSYAHELDVVRQWKRQQRVGIILSHDDGEGEANKKRRARTRTKSGELKWNPHFEAAEAAQEAGFEAREVLELLLDDEFLVCMKALEKFETTTVWTLSESKPVKSLVSSTYRRTRAAVAEYFQWRFNPNASAVDENLCAAVTHVFDVAHAELSKVRADALRQLLLENSASAEIIQLSKELNLCEEPASAKTIASELRNRLFDKDLPARLTPSVDETGGYTVGLQHLWLAMGYAGQNGAPRNIGLRLKEMLYRRHPNLRANTPWMGGYVPQGTTATPAERMPRVLLDGSLGVAGDALALYNARRFRIPAFSAVTPSIAEDKLQAACIGSIAKMRSSFRELFRQTKWQVDGTTYRLNRQLATALADDLASLVRLMSTTEGRDFVGGAGMKWLARTALASAPAKSSRFHLELHKRIESLKNQLRILTSENPRKMIEGIVKAAA